MDIDYEFLLNQYKNTKEQKRLNLLKKNNLQIVQKLELLVAKKYEENLRSKEYEKLIDLYNQLYEIDSNLSESIFDFPDGEKFFEKISTLSKTAFINSETTQLSRDSIDTLLHQLKILLSTLQDKKHYILHLQKAGSLSSLEKDVELAENLYFYSELLKHKQTGKRLGQP